MPYISQSERKRMEMEPFPTPHNSGELNYLLFQQVKRFIEKAGNRYAQHINVLTTLRLAGDNRYHPHQETLQGSSVPDRGLFDAFRSILGRYVDYLRKNLEEKQAFERIENITDVLTDVKDEWRRRYLSVYEDEKLAEHGDVE